MNRMEFNINRKKFLNEKLYSETDINIAYKFSAKLHKEVGPMIKAVVLFGSSVRKQKSKNDIDVLVVLDDTEFEFTRELTHTYRLISKKLISAVSEKIHLTSLKLTNFWEYARSGDPLVVNILRDGKPIIDKGFFDPLQRLLRAGRIRPTPESVHTYFNRAPQTILNSKWHILQASVDLYWAVIDSAHAALMTINEIPPSPDHVADMLDEKLVKTGLINKKYSALMRKFYNLSKMISHREIKEISGHTYDIYLKEATDFVETMRSFIEKKKKKAKN